MVKGDIATTLAGTSLSIQLPKRPTYGVKGRAIVLYTNYFELKNVGPNTELYRYSLAFEEDNLAKASRKPASGNEGAGDVSKARKKRLVQLLLKMAPFDTLPVASDWAQLLVSPRKVPLPKDKDKERVKLSVEWYPVDGEPLPPPSADESDRITAARKRNTYTVLVEDIGTVSVQDLLRDLAQPVVSYPLKLETIQALNVIMTYLPSSDQNIATAGGNKFYPCGSHPQLQIADLGSGLQALRGYFSSVRTSVNRLLVNVNVATGAFYKTGPLLTLMHEVIDGAQQTAYTHSKLIAFVRKLKIETNYLPELDTNGKAKMKGSKPVTKTKVHIITGLSKFNANATTVSFEETDANGKKRKVTVQDYFRTKYNITLTAPRAPLVNYGTEREPKWVPAELCTVTPGQLAKRMLLGPQTSEMIRFAARRPHQNAESITSDGLKVSKIEPFTAGKNTLLAPFGIQVPPTMLTVPGRILPPPRLQYRAQTCNPNNGAWNLDPRALGQKPFRIAKTLGPWNTLIINLGNRDTIPGGVEGASAHLQNFRKTLDTYGLNPGPVLPPVYMNVSFDDLQNRNVAKIQTLLSNTLRTKIYPKPNFMFILLPNDDAVLYDSIKHVCDVRLGLPNICNVGSKFSKEKGQLQYFANVAMKFNQKLGGVNHTVELQNMSPLDAKTIVFGIDVTHPSPGSSDSSPSIAGLVASVDSHFTQFPASIRTQKGRKEMVINLEEMVIERLKLWQKRNQGQLPNKVIVYRDGVSDSQYSIILHEEYPQIKKAFEKLYGGESKHPKMSIIVVGKRHHTRFYPTKEEDADKKTGNPQPGTIVDRGVTGEKLYDFFLLAHQGLQGTSKPAHYVVIKDDNKLGADQLQNLTHNLCYTFARATRAVSVCPPAYYADLVCDRGRSYLQGVLKGDGSTPFTDQEWKRDVHSALAESMFYI